MTGRRGSGAAYCAPTTICPRPSFPAEVPRSSRREARPAGPGRGPGRRTSQAGCPPHREPPAEVRLDLQVIAERAADLQFHPVVPALAGLRGERVERAALVQVNQAEPAPGGVTEAEDGAEQLRAEAARLQRGIHRVQVRDQALDVVRGMTADEPGEAVGIRGHLNRRLVLPHVEQGPDVLLDVAERLALGG